MPYWMCYSACVGPSCIRTSMISVYQTTGMQYTTQNTAGGMNLVAPGAELNFPVAKNVCLVATRYLPHGSFFESRRAVACEINRRPAIFGRRFFGLSAINQVMIDFFKKYAVGYPVAVVEQIET